MLMKLDVMMLVVKLASDSAELRKSLVAQVVGVVDLVQSQVWANCSASLAVGSQHPSVWGLVLEEVLHC